MTDWNTIDQLWDYQDWNASSYVVGWEDQDWARGYQSPPESRLEKGAKITSDKESLFVYEKITEKLDKLVILTHEINDFDVSSTVKNRMNLIRNDIESMYSEVEYLNTRPSEDMPAQKRFDENKLTDIEKEWANKKGFI